MWRGEGISALAEMQAAGLVAIDGGADGAERAELTSWGRRSVGVLMEAIRWERRHLSEPAPVAVDDALALLLMPLPLVQLEDRRVGTCLLTVSLDAAAGRAASAALWLRIRAGRVAEHSAAARRRPAPSALASGSLDQWLDALLDGDPDRLRLKGRVELASDLILGIHTELRQSNPS